MSSSNYPARCWDVSAANFLGWPFLRHSSVTFKCVIVPVWHGAAGFYVRSTFRVKPYLKKKPTKVLSPSMCIWPFFFRERNRVTAPLSVRVLQWISPSQRKTYYASGPPQGQLRATAGSAPSHRGVSSEPPQYQLRDCKALPNLCKCLAVYLHS